MGVITIWGDEAGAQAAKKAAMSTNTGNILRMAIFYLELSDKGNLRRGCSPQVVKELVCYTSRLSKLVRAFM
jgi:hypothetical protein